MATNDPFSAVAISPMMTVCEVAAIVRKSAFTVRKLARLGALPGARRLGREWVFQRRKIEKFAQG